MKAGILIVGLGNPLLGDDSVGWHVAAQVQRGITSRCEVDFLTVGGLALMERFVGYDRVILIDALVTGQQPMGSVVVFELCDLPETTVGHLTSAHDTTLQAALKVGQVLGIALPTQITVVGIEAQHLFDFTETLSPPVAAAIPVATQVVIEMLAERNYGIA